MKFKIFLLVSLALAVSASAFAKRSRPLKVACIGNSITYGMTLPEREKQSYPSRLQEMLGDGYVVGNFGKSGATLLRHGHRPYNEQDEYKAAIEFAGDIVVIHLGINDTDPRNWPDFRDEFVADYLQLVSDLRKANPHAVFYIARLSPISHRHPRFKSGTRDWRDEIQLAIADVARAAGAMLIDFEKPLLAYPWMLPDGLHPNPDGAERLASTVYSSITGDYGGLQMPPIYTDSMVLPQGRKFKISGTADSGSNISVSIGRQVHHAVAGNDGHWSVEILPLLPGEGMNLVVTDGERRLVFKDVAAGEIWLCSGQSNMEFQLRNSIDAESAITDASNTGLRLYDMKPRWITDATKWPQTALDSLNRLQYFKDARWQKANSENAGGFSAVGFYFGRMLQDSLIMPVGLICNAVGGSPTEAWIDRVALEHGFPDILSDWTSNDFIQGWVRERAKYNLSESGGDKLQRHPYEPAYLYEAGIEQLAGFPIDGVIWYQGESNAHNADAHEKLFGMLVNSWRDKFDAPRLPFCFVQLSSINRPSWPYFRDSQRRLAGSMRDVYMAVSSDVGDSLDVHPRDKRPVGERLARLALGHVYGFGITVSGPEFDSATVEGSAVYVRFINGDGMHGQGGDPICGFELASVEGMYFPAVADVAGDGLLCITCDSVKIPRYVRYAWQPFTRANLVNSDGLPASTFRSEVGLPEIKVGIVDMPDAKICGKAYSKGVSAAFAGMAGGQVIMAGGCNFPDVPAADGGKKRFYDYVVSLENIGDTPKWRHVGHLPSPVAYGVSVTTADGVVCAGGMTPNDAVSDVSRLYMDARGKLTVEQLPSLPSTVDNASGASVGNCIYIVGGNIDGVPGNAVFRLDLTDLGSGWVRMPDFPGNPRIQPVCVALKDSCGSDNICIWGGFAPVTKGCDATLNIDGLSFDVTSGQWRPLGDAPVSLGGGVAVAVSPSKALAIGGVNEEVFLKALKSPEDGYMNHEPEWYRFNKGLLIYDLVTGQWRKVSEDKRFARAGAMAIPVGTGVLVTGGELKPGIRTPSTIFIDFSKCPLQ